nr:cleavage/polyadenylation specificity factor, 25kDa subunit [Tanacetum cinerariifolium]
MTNFLVDIPKKFHVDEGDLIEAVDSDGHLRSCPGLGVVDGGRRTRSYDRLAGPRRIKVGSWNVRSLTRKLLEFCDTLGRHKVDIACFQETKWKGSRAREGNGYKLWYSGSSNARNDVGIILAGRLKDNVVRVTRRCDRIMAISVVIEGETANVISAYAPQVGLSDAKNKRFWDALDELTFRAIVVERLAALEEVMSASGADQIWNTLAHVMKDATKESLGVANETARTHSTHRESWWFCEEVQTKVTLKQSRFKELLSCREGNQEDIDLVKERYKVAKREEKITVANAKDKAYKDLYKKLDSKEEANDIYKIAKVRERRRRDIGNVRYIKDEVVRTIVREEDIRKRWGEHLSPLFNENPSDESRADVGRAVGSSSPHMHYECYYSRINQGEVKTASKKMGRNKAKYSERQRDLHMDFLDLEKAYDSVLRELVWKTLIDKGTPRIYSRVIKDMYEGAKTHGIQEDIPWCMIFADDIVLIAESAERLNNRLESWRKALEDNGLQVSREKTEYLRCDFGRYEVVHQKMDIRIGDRILQPKESFRYLGVLRDWRIPLKLKGKFYKVAIRPAMLYRSECWPITKAQATRVEVAELRMLSWICSKTMIDMIPNGVFRAALDVDYIVNKMRE